MSTHHTTNYDLNQWEASDKVLRTEFNADNAKIDAALKANADAIAAEAAAREAGVSGKADQSALSAESSARQAADEALEAALGSLGNCQMELLTYTGTGKSGSGNPTQITFAALPDLFLIGGDMTLLFGRGGVSNTIIASEEFLNNQTASWNGTQLSIQNSVNARYQMNSQGMPYWVLGLKRKI